MAIGTKAVCGLSCRYQGVQGGEGEETNDDEVILDAFQAKEVKRNSVKLVEAAFDNDLDEVKAWLEKVWTITLIPY